MFHRYVREWARDKVPGLIVVHLEAETDHLIDRFHQRTLDSTQKAGTPIEEVWKSDEPIW